LIIVGEELEIKMKIIFWHYLTLKEL
jgi:hypothetical protein